MTEGRGLEKIYRDATEVGLRIARELLSDPEKVATSPITLGAAVGALYGSIAKSEKILPPGVALHSKEWLDMFFLTMTGGLKETMEIEISVDWSRKETP